MSRSVMRFRRSLSLVLVTAAAGCGDQPRHAGDDVGQVSAALSASGSTHDVAEVAFALVPATGSCTDPPVTSTMISLAGGGAQALMLVAPGAYLVCARPLTGAGAPSAFCAPAQAPATVLAGATTDVALVSQCNGAGNGGLQGTVTFNDPPQITGVTLPPAANTCQPATVAVTASDADGDALSYTWAVVSAPGAATVAGSGATATLTAGAAGEHQLQVTVTDASGAATSLTFPVEVANGAPCP